MVEIRKPIPVEKAIREVMNYASKGIVEEVPIENSHQRRLAQQVVATNNVPSFHKSPYDGFALRSIDTNEVSLESPIEFEVVEHIGAGQVPTKKLHNNQATRIMTGAQIPEGADCVAMFEICKTYKKDDKTYVSLKRKMEMGQNIIKEGSEVVMGEVLIEKGTMITPGVIASLATFGYSSVKVAREPVIGIIATGTELLDVDEELRPGKIRNSNAYMISSQIERAGGTPKYLGKLADELESSYETIKEALEEVDHLVTTGGVSVGDFDLMPAIYEKLGAEVLFNKIAMRPGSVTTVAVLGNQLLFGLSGNPSACYVGGELFLRPIIQASQFSTTPYLKRIKATLADEFPKPNPFTRFVRCYVVYKDGKVYTKVAGIDKSNVVTSLAYSDCLMVLPGGTRGFKIGDEVEILLLNNYEGQQDFN
ncbi:gephyrin-like molybdotransferase Glp [Virgibacillus halodenitrificans]|uniref:molybdopterin molybdotransferase MoeA n=1 Tax=Virgibacillus halodenitrificans TaxID=1482 RepID=UPI0002E2ED71|nr:gephyrin-like molybdotransferase Glp [Virgibacillus halodenitrificans]